MSEEEKTSAPHLESNSENQEHVPTEENIRSMFDEIIGIGAYEISRNLEDPKGLYLFEVKTTDSEGCVIEYNYMRKGRYPEGGSIMTSIEKIEYDKDGMPCGGDCIANNIGGEWLFQK